LIANECLVKRKNHRNSLGSTTMITEWGALMGDKTSGQSCGPRNH
jgi:hypothetical protein